MSLFGEYYGEDGCPSENDRSGNDVYMICYIFYPY